MIYPTIAEYVDAILSAEDNLDKLSNLRPVLDGNGRPVMSSGNYAVVFKMTDGDKYYALKCFTKEQEGRDEAYRMIVDELEFVQSSYIVPIKYLPNELFVNSNNTDVKRFPVVQMEWVEGDYLFSYIHHYINDEYALNLLAYQFSRLAMWLLSQPIAHGDLKPDNIMVRHDGTLVLVDYDGMYVPAMRGIQSCEVDSSGYCHSLRSIGSFNEHIDDFSIAVIALSLKAIALKPALLYYKNFLIKQLMMGHSLFYTTTGYRYFSKSEIISSIQSLLNDSLLNNIELERLYALLLLAHSQNELPTYSFRLFALERPENPKYEDLSTEVTFEEVDNGIADAFSVVYSKDRKRLLEALFCDEYYNYCIEHGTEPDEYDIKYGTIIICDNAFWWHGQCWKQINIPNSVTKIGSRAFCRCSSLKYINIPNSVTTIGEGAFEDSISLREINISNSVTTIEDRTFENCKSLLKINIPNSITTIGESAFENCKSLKQVNIPNGVTTVGRMAFASCIFLEQISIPNSVTTIGVNAFCFCLSLKQIHISNRVVKISNNTFSCCKSLQQVNIPNSVVEIGEGAFSECESLQQINIPNSVSVIEDFAFRNCHSLKQINIFAYHTAIGSYAFQCCTSLKHIYS